MVEIMYTGQPGLNDLQRPLTDPNRNATRLMFGRVVAVHDDTDQIDVALLGGGRLDHVPIIGPAAGRSYGSAALPVVTAGYETATATGAQDVYALIGYLRGEAELPICLGFVGPKDSDLLRRPKGANIRRERGGQLHLSFADGSEERRYSGGASVRVGASSTLATIDSSLAPSGGSNAIISFVAPGGFLIGGKQLTLNSNLTVTGGNATISGGGALTLAGFTLTVPATMTAAGRDVANTFTATQTIRKGDDTGLSQAIQQLVFEFYSGSFPHYIRTVHNSLDSSQYLDFFMQTGGGTLADTRRALRISSRSVQVGVIGSPLNGIGDLDANGAIRGATIQDATNNLPWKLGAYTAGAPAATGYVTVNINGTNYKLLTST